MTENPLGSNRGKYIDSWNDEIVGIKGVPWCATSLSIAMKGCIPSLESGRALDFRVSGYSLPIKAVLTGNYIPKSGDIIVWSYGGGAGHVDIVIHYNSSDTLQTFTKFGLDEDLKPKHWLVIGGNRSDKMALAKFRTNRAIDKGLKYITPVDYD
jgi:hypothetical protein